MGYCPAGKQKKVAGRGQNRGRTAGNGVHWTRRRLNDVEWLQWGCVPIQKHTRTHTLTHSFMRQLLFFFFRFCSCGLRTSFVSVCEIVRARAVISSHIRYHNFPYFYCARRIQQKKLGILISSAKYWTPGTINSQTLAHTFLLGSLSLRSIQPDFRFPPDVNFTWPHHTTVSANFPQNHLWRHFASCRVYAQVSIKQLQLFFLCV